jgi:hypothetical protein
MDFPISDNAVWRDDSAPDHRIPELVENFICGGDVIRHGANPPARTVCTRLAGTAPQATRTAIPALIRARKRVSWHNVVSFMRFIRAASPQGAAFFAAILI